MDTKVVFEDSQIAPCGMNCGSCLGYLREKNKCPGCRVIFKDKAKSRVNCIIRNCERLAGGTSGLCHDCEKFPCRRMKDLDKRYRTKYRTSLIENLQIIGEKGIGVFLEFEAARRTCPSCGEVLCVHRVNCLKCNKELSQSNTEKSLRNTQKALRNRS